MHANNRLPLVTVDGWMDRWTDGQMDGWTDGPQMTLMTEQLHLESKLWAEIMIRFLVYHSFPLESL